MDCSDVYTNAIIKEFLIFLWKKQPMRTKKHEGPTNVIIFSWLWILSISIPTFFFFNYCILGPHLWYMEVPRLGVKLELQLPVYTTATATQDPSHVCSWHHTAHGNARSWTHWMRPGIKSTTSQFLVGFHSTVPWQKLQQWYSWTLIIPSRRQFYFKRGRTMTHGKNVEQGKSFQKYIYQNILFLTLLSFRSL